MKRSFILLLIVLFMFLPSCALAGTPEDLAGCTDDELLDLIVEIQKWSDETISAIKEELATRDTGSAAALVERLCAAMQEEGLQTKPDQLTNTTWYMGSDCFFVDDIYLGKHLSVLDYDADTALRYITAYYIAFFPTVDGFSVGADTLAVQMASPQIISASLSRATVVIKGYTHTVQYRISDDGRVTMSYYIQ